MFFFFLEQPPSLFFYCLLYFPRKARPDSASLSSLSLLLSPSLSVCLASLQELERFKSFVKRTPAFDVVVDGLNVANISKDKSRQSEMVWKHAAARCHNTIIR